MFIFLRRIWMALLLAASLPASAQMYKWVDENGTVHFGSSCPEDVDCSILESAPAPSREAVEAANRRSEALRSSRQREESKEAEEQQVRQAAGAESADNRNRAQSCEQAFYERDLLEIDLPVYRDADRVLHHRESLHHHWYTGQRAYLEDDQRLNDLERVNALIDAQCQGLLPARENYVYRYRDKPTLDETLELLDRMLDSGGPPVADTCAYARLMSNDLQEMKKGIPSSKERELGRRVTERCR